MAKIDTKELFDLADELSEERANTLEKQKANREALRNFSTMGLLSQEEEARLEEVYPTRVRGGNDLDED